MGSLKVHSRARRHAMFGLTLMALLGSACSSFTPKAEVQTKQVAIDLAFGAKVDPKIVVDDPALRPLDETIPELPDPVRPKPPVIVEPDLCPPPSALGPKYEAPARIKSGPFYPEDGSAPDENEANTPPSGNFLFKFSGNRAGEPLKEDFGYKVIDGVATEILPGTNYEAYRYAVNDPFTGMSMRFTVVPATEQTEAAGRTADGLFLRQIDIPRFGSGPRDEALEFIPASSQTTGGLRIFDFPIEPGQVFEDQSAEVAAKDKVTDANGQAVFRQSGNTINTRVIVGNLTTIPVCDQLARTWKIAWEITSTGEYPFQIAGNFYMGTHIGGWPLKEDFVIFSEGDKVISGNFSSNMARIDPGDYL